MTKILENMAAVQERRKKMLEEYREKVKEDEYEDDEFEREDEPDSDDIEREEIQEEIIESEQNPNPIEQSDDQWEITMALPEEKKEEK